MFTLIEVEIKAKLERALHRRISLAEWQDVKDSGLLGEYERGDLSWSDFKNVVDETLDRLRRHVRNVLREQASELNLASEIPCKVKETVGLPDVPARLSDRTSARGEALSALTRLYMGNEAAQNVMESGRARISSTIFPRGGVDGTLPQWVIVMGVEAWVPADDVKETYSRLRQTFIEEQPQPKTQARTFQVAAFVWNQERAHGERPPWPVLCERWNNWPLTDPFEDWRAFRMCFLRGEKATLPRYRATNEQMTELVRSRSHQGVFDIWASQVRE
jgi:hypothetical protein